MIIYGKYKSSILENGKRILKFLGVGGSASTASESMPFGIDSNPIADMIAIHSTTSNNAESVIIGYINKNQIAEIGESRLYSLDANGVLKAFIYCKNDGILLLNGDSYSGVRYEPLKSGLDNQNNLINAELLKIQTAITTLGGAYTRSNVSIDITTSKSDTVKIK